jgi:hypothetical protein
VPATARKLPSHTRWCRGSLIPVVCVGWYHFKLHTPRSWETLLKVTIVAPNLLIVVSYCNHSQSYFPTFTSVDKLIARSWRFTVLFIARDKSNTTAYTFTSDLTVHEHPQNSTLLDNIYSVSNQYHIYEASKFGLLMLLLVLIT